MATSLNIPSHAPITGLNNTAHSFAVQLSPSGHLTSAHYFQLVNTAKQSPEYQKHQSEYQFRLEQRGDAQFLVLKRQSNNWTGKLTRAFGKKTSVQREQEREAGAKTVVRLLKNTFQNQAKTEGVTTAVIKTRQQAQQFQQQWTDTAVAGKFGRAMLRPNYKSNAAADQLASQLLKTVQSEYPQRVLNTMSQSQSPLSDTSIRAKAKVLANTFDLSTLAELASKTHKSQDADTTQDSVSTAASNANRIIGMALRIKQAGHTRPSPADVSIEDRQPAPPLPLTQAAAPSHSAPPPPTAASQAASHSTQAPHPSAAAAPMALNETPRSEMPHTEIEQRAYQLSKQLDLQALNAVRQKAKDDLQMAQKENRPTVFEKNVFNIATLATHLRIQDDMSHAVRTLPPGMFDDIRNDTLVWNTEKAERALSVMSRSEISARDTDERASNLAQQFGIKTLDKLRQKAKEDMQAAQKEQRLTHREINAYTIATLATDQKIRDDMAHALKSLSAESLDAIRDDHLLINTEKAANALSIMSRSTVLSPKDKATRAQNLAQAYPLASLHVAWQKAKETLLASQKENRPSAQESNAYTIATLAMHQKIQQDHRYAVLQLPDGVPLEISRAAHGTSLTP